MRSILLIDGMRTVHCVRAVFQALAGVGGVVSADVSLGRAEVEHGGEVSDTLFSAALDSVGYRLRERRPDDRRLAVLGDDARDR